MMRFTLSLLAFGLFVASILSMLGYSLPAHVKPVYANKPVTALTSCTVKIIFDGDTFGCDLNNDKRIQSPEEHIRMLGIDTPEMHYSKKNKTGKNQPYALEATRYVEELTLNKTVYLEFDQEKYDTHDRILAYVYLDPERKTMLNERLLDEGFATLMFIRVNRRYEPEFDQLAQQAQAKHRKIWSLPSSVSQN